MHLTHASRDRAQLRDRVLSAYRQHIKSCTHEFTAGGLTWQVSAHDTLTTDPRKVVRIAQDIENNPENWLKHSRINLVGRTNLGSHSILVKRYSLQRYANRIRYRFRASRARRAWAAANTMRAFDIQTPEPYAFVEGSRGATPLHSFYLHEYVDQATTARRWIKTQMHRLPRESRNQVRRELSHRLLELYRHGIYHGDTKAGNLLLTAPDYTEKRMWHWIDLDCVQFGVPLTHRRVLRNLVQLNGSIGAKIDETERMAFLQDLAIEFPWVTEQKVAEVIRYRTMKRLRRELSGECGH